MHVEWQITHRSPNEEDKKKIRKTSPYVNDKDFRIFSELEIRVEIIENKATILLAGCSWSPITS